MINNELLKLLCQIGFVSLQRDVRGEAGAIFQSLRLFRPENACGFIGQALLLAQRGDVARAVAVVDPSRASWTEARDEAAQIHRMLTVLEAELAA